MAKSKKSSKPRVKKGDPPVAPVTTATTAPNGDARSQRRRRRQLQPVAVVPILFTLGNLVAGFAAIHFAAKPLEFNVPLGSSLSLAGLCVFIGMFFDAVDGSVARLTRTESEIGAQLDSLADLVTFGVAPAFMMMRLASHYVGAEVTLPILSEAAGSAFSKVIWGVAAAYVACTALRLARFNVESPSGAVEHHMIFRGLPSPGAGGAIASLIVLHQHYLSSKGVALDEVTLAFARGTAFGIPLLTLLCAVAMVSSIPYIHFVNRYLRGRHSFGYAGGVVIVVLLVLFWFQEAMALAFTAFALSGPVRLGYLRLRRRNLAKAG